MSAFIVDKATIDAIVTFSLHLTRDESDKEPFALFLSNPAAMARGTALGKTLWSENYASVNARYSERDKRPAYKFVPVLFHEPDMKAIAPRVLGCLRGYVYQSCEHDGWEASDANKAIIEPLRVKLESLVPHRGNRYTTPPWQIPQPIHVGWVVGETERYTAFTCAAVEALMSDRNAQ